MQASMWYQRLSLLVLCWSSLVHAAEPEISRLQFNGFISQGFLLTSDNQIFGDSESGSFDFGELGLNVSYELSPRLRVAGQAISRRAGATDNGALRLDYGLIDYAVLSELNQRAGIRLGRVKNPFGFYNDTRDVPFTRPSILLPQGIYLDRLRNLALAADGAQVYFESDTTQGAFTFQLNLGQGRLDENLEYALLDQDWPGHFATAPDLISGRLLYQTPDGQWQLGLSGYRLDLAYEPGVNDPLGSGMVDISSLIASVGFEAAPWTLTAEYQILAVHLHGPGAGFTDTAFIEGNYALQLGYRASAAWDVFLRYDVNIFSRDDPDGTIYAAENPGVPASARYARDWTLGLHYDLSENWMLRTEYHLVHGTAWLPTQENPLTTARTPDWRLFALLLSYRF